MIDKLVSNLHFFILAYVAYSGYGQFQAYESRLKQEKARVPIIEKRIARKASEYNEIKKFYEEREKMKTRINAIAQEIEKSQQRLPNVVDKSSTLAEIKSIAEGLNIKDFITGNGSKEENKDFYLINYFELKARGTYLQFLIFLEKLAQQKRILNVRSLKFNRGRRKSSRRGRFQLIDVDIQVESYKYNSAHKVNTGIMDIENKFKAPKSFNQRKSK